ncbi:MAG TPA: hypothetical protein VHC43_05340 [Mycobacteriales bacterium]|nr:hypothetical protein [Mycobacteriales bacterium]
MRQSPDVATLREALVHAIAALKAAELPFAVAGGYALYAWGSTEPDHDADVVVERRSLDAARLALADAGFDIEQPPEDWLIKAWWRGTGSDAFVDVIFELAGEPVSDDLLRRAQTRLLHAVHAPVLAPHDVIAAKLRVLTEHCCDYTPLLRATRAIREQVDWKQLRRESAANPYAQGFLDLVDRLRLADTRP